MERFLILGFLVQTDKEQANTTLWNAEIATAKFEHFDKVAGSDLFQSLNYHVEIAGAIIG